MNNYDKFPEIKVNGYEDCALQGYEAIGAKIKEDMEQRDKRIVVIDCYPGVDKQEIVEGLKDLKFDLIIYSDTCALKEERLIKKIEDYLTEDRVFGVLTTKKLEELFIAEKIEKARENIQNAKGNILVVGVGAGLITKGDIYIFADLARWEIQMRYRKGMSNWNVSNGDAPILTKYKTGFFLEWRMADKHKVENYKHFDYILDTNIPNEPKMVTGEAFFEGLKQTVQRPFRVVPYFDPGVWGGQWMKEVCNLDRGEENYAWSFDGVPEENSLYLRYGDVRIEVPAIDLVLYKPIELLGNKVHARFGAEFPIRFDFLDTMEGQNLSLQVHPVTEYIQQNFGMHYTQDESYYILDCKEDAKVYLGTKEDIEPREMIEDLQIAQRGKGIFDAEKYINIFAAKKHDHFLIPAGTVHCSGKNAMVLEISATPYIFTFKLWDWGRIGLDGLPRPIHIEHGEKVIQWDRTTKWVKENLINQIETVKEGDGYIEEKTGLHEREFIETRRHWFDKPVVHSTQNSVNMLNLVEGEEVTVESPTGAFEPFVVHYAETFIIPECVREYLISPSGESKGKKVATIKAYVR